MRPGIRPGTVPAAVPRREPKDMKQTPPETQSPPRHTYRQRSSVLLALCFVLGAVILVVSALLSWGDHPQPLFVAWLLFGCAVAWTVFVRPCVVLDQDGVHLRNIVRDVDIPWPLVSDVETRWNLRVWSGDDGHTAWAIASQVERPKVHASVLPGLSSKLDGFPGQGASTPGASTKVTSRMVAEAIDETAADYAAAVADGDLQPPAHPAVTTRWAPLPVLALALPLLAVLVLSIW
jgi:hypothetical protein